MNGLRVVERLPGDATTNFGAPGVVADADGRAVAARDLAEKILAHVRDAEAAYCRKLGGTPPRGDDDQEERAAFLDALGSRARGEVPDIGPRGRSRWPARYGARRAAWHVLDHAWEIEDRSS